MDLQESDGQENDEDWESFENDLKSNVSFWINGVLIPIICLFGIAGNLLCIFIFCKKDVELKPSFANLLKSLSIYDIIFLVCMLFMNCIPQLSVYYTLHILPYVDPYIYPCIRIALTGSVYTTIGVAVERFLTLYYPFRRCQMSNGLGYIIPITLFSVLYNVVRFLEMETDYMKVEEWSIADNGTNVSSITIYPRIKASSLRRNPKYMLIMVTLINNIVMGLLPIVLLSILNFLIYNLIAKINAIHNNIAPSNRRENKMAGLLMAIVFVFLCCHTIKFGLNIFEAYEMLVVGKLSSPLWVLILVDINHILLAINSAVNIIIYSFKDLKFRYVLMKSFCKKHGYPPDGFSRPSSRRRRPLLSTSTQETAASFSTQETATSFSTQETAASFSTQETAASFPLQKLRR